MTLFCNNYLQYLLRSELEEWTKEQYLYKLQLSKGMAPDVEALKCKILTCHCAKEEIKLLMYRIKEEENDFNYIRLFLSPQKKDPTKLNYYTFMKLYVKNEENLGKQIKPISILFANTIELPTKTGTLVIKKDKMKKPSYFEIRIVDNIKKYPFRFSLKGFFSKLSTFFNTSCFS